MIIVIVLYDHSTVFCSWLNEKTRIVMIAKNNTTTSLWIYNYERYE